MRVSGIPDVQMAIEEDDERHDYDRWHHPPSEPYVPGLVLGLCFLCDTGARRSPYWRRVQACAEAHHAQHEADG